MTGKRKRKPIGQTIGGVLFGFEQQTLRNAPPPEELVHHARPDDPVPSPDGGLLTIELPERALPRDVPLEPAVPVEPSEP
jgi:hypothetical protein